MDNLTKEQRSQTMRAVRSTDTTPELVVRRLIFSFGFRYRLHARRIPGCPDLIFATQKKAIFIHGCFWHCHNCRAGKNRPKTNVAYWTAKLGKNKVRDRRTRRELQRLGWRVLVLWECQIADSAKLRERLIRFLTA